MRSYKGKYEGGILGGEGDMRGNEKVSGKRGRG